MQNGKLNQQVGRIGEVVVACACVLALFVSSARAAEEPTNLAFNPQLSLTGDCTTSEADPVPDPGCPGGTHPPQPITNPTAIATDSYGDVYVANTAATLLTTPDEGAIDIFNASGEYLTQLVLNLNPRSMAVDSKGNLYVSGYSTKGNLRRYAPTTYDPAASQVTYSSTPIFIDEGQNGTVLGLAVNPANDHLFINRQPQIHAGDPIYIGEYGSAEEGNPLLDPEVAEVDNEQGGVMVVDAVRGRLYANTESEGTNQSPEVIDVFELAPPHHLIKVIDGSTLPEGKFRNSDDLFGGVDESTGHLFIYSPEISHSLYEFTAEGEYLATIKHGFSGHYRGLAVDNGIHSPNGAENLDGRTIWVTSAAGLGAEGHAFAFGPPSECPASVESASVDHVGETEASLKAEVQPCALETHYRFEYVTEEQYAESEFAAATVAAEGTIPTGASPVAVSTGVFGLTPGTSYRWRVVASNALGSDEAVNSVATYPTPPLSTSCPNETLRYGHSLLLPDCRAYELVTPPSTNGLAPNRMELPTSLSYPVSPAGDKVAFRVSGGVIPGSTGTGSIPGDPYVANRGPNGWHTENVGGAATEATSISGVGRSPELGYSVWRAEGEGPAILPQPGRLAPDTVYLRYPDGHSEPLGKGSLGVDPSSAAELITRNASHVIFTSTAHVEEAAAPAPQQALYDRTSDGITHVVSLLPNGQPVRSTQSEFAGASPEGRSIAFEAGEQDAEALYLRYNDEETFQVGAPGAEYEGIAEGGRRIFYLEEGNLFAFDVGGGIVPFATSGDATVANVSRDGTAAYFISPSKLASEPNPLGQRAKRGQQNLYLSREGAISYVATVAEADVLNHQGSVHGVEGLGTWSGATDKMIGAKPGDPSRSTADGSVFVFQASTKLTGYENDEKPEIYRFGPAAGELRCLSCNPTGLPASTGAAFMTPLRTLEGVSNNALEVVENLSADGKRFFFESTEPLLAADIDGLRDVYEWEAQGSGTCTVPAGCVYLISSGESSQDNYLYGVSESGDDVFIRSSDVLAATDPDDTASIYDARVNGGFAITTPPAQCLGEACQPAATPPERPAQVLHGAGNVSEGKEQCGKGAHPIQKGGRRRCVKSHHHRSRHGHNKHGRHGKANNHGREQR
jgi:hypothetical protein